MPALNSYLHRHAAKANAHTNALQRIRLSNARMKEKEHFEDFLTDNQPLVEQTAVGFAGEFS